MTKTPRSIRMDRYLGWLSMSLVVLIASLLFASPKAAGADEARVVYHADFSDPRRFSAMLTSINNMVVHYDDNFIDHDVRIVFVSHGVRFVTDDPLAGTPFAEDETLREERANLRGRLLALNSLHNVRLELCDITRGAVNLAEDGLYDAIDLVPSGVVRLAQLQNAEGFAYIKVE
jgi:intracellular sulfur oxidation DsrE/DsrF family protein